MADLQPLTNWLYVNPSTLRHTVSVQTLNRTGDQWTVTDSNLSSAGWTTVYTGRAAIESIGGIASKEALNDGALASVSTHVITMRWNPSYTIVAGNQIVFGAKVYRVQIARNFDERNILWKLLCVEVPAL
jgi:hypothetical protein